MDLKLRPILQNRMPTLATRAAFILPQIDDMPHLTGKLKGLKKLESSPPRSIQDLRSIINTEIRSINKKLARLERSYYGVGKSIQNEVEKYTMPIKGVMRMLTMFELGSATSVENAIKAGSDPKRYKGDPNNIVLLKEAYTKVQTYIPEKFNDITENCLKLLDIMEKYFVSFFHPESDVYLETAAHYTQQIENWKRNIRSSLERVGKLYRDFKDRMVHYTMFSPPVVAFCKKNECEPVCFLLLFPDVCTNIRSAMAEMQNWLQQDENYPMFLRNDIDDMEKRREEKIKLMRESKQKYHSALYKLNQAEIEYDKAIGEVETMKEKEEALRIEADYYFNLNSDLERDLDFKEFRKEGMKKNVDAYTPQHYNEEFELLTDEIRCIRDRLPSVKRAMAAAQHKLQWVTEKRSHVNKIKKELMLYKKELDDIKRGSSEREEDFAKLEKSLELARRVHRYKTSSDMAEKIYFCLPLTSRNPRGHTLSLSNEDDLLNKVCLAVSQHIDEDWMQLYRRLDFYPKRGKHTVEKDITDIANESARLPKDSRVLAALSRWRRHHTRAKVSDLTNALREIKRLDVLQVVEEIINPPKVVEEVKEIYVPPSVAPELVPFYKDVVRYDQIKASRKSRSEKTV